LTLATPTPALDRPEAKLSADEKRRRHQRSSRVDRARPQAEKDGVTGADSNEAPGKKHRPTAEQGNARNQEPGTADRRHNRNEPVADDRRIGDDGAKRRETGQSAG
jgi:hypothetical protein